MSTPELQGRLVAFLQDAYERQEVLRMLNFRLGQRGMAVAQRLEDDMPNVSDVAYNFLRTLRQHGLLDDAFWSLWAEKRDHRVDELRATQRAFLAGDATLEDVHRLLLDCFDLFELEGDFGLTNRFGPPLLAALAPGFFPRAVTRMHAARLVNEDFWQALKDTRDQRLWEIQALQDAWEAAGDGAAKDTQTSPSRAPVSADDPLHLSKQAQARSRERDGA